MKCSLLALPLPLTSIYGVTGLSGAGLGFTTFVILIGLELFGALQNPYLDRLCLQCPGDYLLVKVFARYDVSIYDYMIYAPAMQGNKICHLQSITIKECHARIEA